MERPASVLIVDDSPEQILATGSILKEHGYRALVASSGKAALDVLSRTLPDLILLDIHMKDMDGFTLCSQLRCDSRYQDTAIIFMTVSQDRESLEQGFLLGAQDYITKPCHASELLARVGAHIRIVTQSKELKAAYRELDQFCHSVSHDLKSPLQVLKQMVQLLRDDLTEEHLPISEDTLSILERLEGKCGHMENMINRLLDFSQMTAMSFTPEALDGELLIQTIFDELAGLEPDRLITLKISPHPFPALFGDRTLMTLLFQNILGNAIKFTRGRAHAHILVSAQHRHQTLTITIQDNGAGFDMTASEKLFHVFERFHTAREFEGSGVGLAIVKRIMERHGGDVSIEASSGKGATVSLTFRYPTEP